MGGNNAYNNYENLTFFLTDGQPNATQGNANDLNRVDGITKGTLAKYDTTPITTVNGLDPEKPPVLVNFNGNNGLNGLNAWKHEGTGDMGKNAGRLRIRDNNPSDASSSKVTMEVAHTITAPTAVRFSFDASVQNWTNADTFTWRVLKWDAAVNDWIVAEQGSQAGNDVTTSMHGPDEYLLQFEVNDRSSAPGSGTATVFIDDIWIRYFADLGDAQIVLDPKDLEAALIGNSEFDEPVPVGDDVIHGGKGNDTLIGGAGDDVFRWEFGDAGTVDAPALDVIKDFGMDDGSGSDPNGNDVLDLRDLLVDEENNDLSQYLNFSYDGTDTVLKVSSTGGLDINGNGYDQLITLEGVDLTGGFASQTDIINNLIGAGKLQVDQ